MAVAAYFHPKGLTLAQYNQARERLTDAGAGEPAGRLHHSSFGPDGDLMIFEVWDSAESFHAFGPTLMPILADLGIEAGAPDVIEVHGLVQTEVAP
jgi:hypothetical protein